MGRRGRQLIEERFSRSILAAKLANLLEEMERLNG
jgi:hypothetical protein